jgi:hypothetical protein
MRSPDSRRSVFEAMLRVLSVVAMATLAVRFWTGAARLQPEVSATSDSLDSALTSWSQVAPRRATVRASHTPDSRQRDWLVAIRRTGTQMSWSAEDTGASALMIEPGPMPDGVGRLALLGRPNSKVMLSDELGRIDSVRIGHGGAAWLRVRPLGTIRSSSGTSAPVTVVRDSLVVKPVLLVGSAGWEARFLAAALEEDGWTISMRLQVAPGAIVRQGRAAALDTASFSAVIVIDSVSPLDAGVMSRFVHEGGGLVASGPGLRHPALRALLPRAAGQTPGTLGALLGPSPRSGLTTRALVVSANNVVFERRNGAAVVGASRIGSGRVVAAGYDDTWRLRMVPPNENAPRWHRDWWSALVGGTAMARIVPREGPAGDEAPLAATVASLGPPAAPGDLPEEGGVPFPWDTVLAAVAGTALLAEWLSRRLRGVA